jgi:glycosyltransferase involved in cell wall biosynthesis
MKSVVIPTRNDNYGYFLTERTIQCLNNMVSNFDEVIVVDWNSPDGVPAIRQAINSIQKTGKIRCIVVPKEVVEQHIPHDTNPCCDVIARNVGIQRARSEWILSSNIDILCSPFDERSLSSDTMYTSAKYTVPEHVHLLHTLPMSNEDKMMFLKNNKQHFPRMELCANSIHHRDDVYSLCTGCGDFQLAHRDLWNAIRGYEEALHKRDYADTNVQVKAANHPSKKISLLDVDIFHMNHDTKCPYLTKGSSLAMNKKEDAFVTYATTANSETWGLADHTFEEIVI